MVGVTLYVSITTEESIKIDQDLRVMHPSYGFSFFCAVFSFVLQELTGVLTVYWFIYRFRALVRKQEKLRERTRQVMGNCFSMTTTLPIRISNSFSLNPQVNSHPSIDFLSKQQRGRIPFDLNSSRSNDKSSYSTGVFPQSKTLAYGDYCRVLIRSEDLDLLTRIVKSKSQAHLPNNNSRPSTPAPINNSKMSTHMTRRNLAKGVKRTTSV